MLSTNFFQQFPVSQIRAAVFTLPYRSLASCLSMGIGFELTLGASVFFNPALRRSVESPRSLSIGRMSISAPVSI